MVNGFSLEEGDSFELQDWDGTHLHIIIAAESSAEHTQLIIVYVSSSETKYKDRTTIIKPGEHPYITKSDHESWIRYQHTKVCNRHDLLPLITRHYGKIPDDLLKRIQDGFMVSRNVSRQTKRLFEEWRMNRLFDSF